LNGDERLFLYDYIKIAVASIFIIILLYLPYLFVFKKDTAGIVRKTSYLLCFLSLYLVVFATVILFNLPFDFNQEHSLNYIPFERFNQATNISKTIFTEIVPNILLFIPLGFFIPTAFRKTRRILKTSLIILSVTFCVEFFQYFIERKCDIDDIITNMLGGIIGYGLFKTANHLCKNRKLWNLFIGQDKKAL